MSEADEGHGFEPSQPEDRTVALLAAIEARGDTLERPRCHGYENCCHCTVCDQRESRNGRRLAA